ncbi:MAG: FtsQ-type POTRA domain-containing protein, partial [Chloroflexota bacterium]
MSVNSSSSTSRADQVRQRRTQKTQSRVVPARKTIPTAPQRSQPAAVRGLQSSGAIPLRKTTPMRVRKQYYYSLGATGAEIRLPAIPLINPGARLVSAALLLVSILALYTLAFGAQFEVPLFKVEGIQRLSYADIEAVLNLEGSQIIEFDPRKAAADLAKAYPELASIHISIGLPAEVNIQVVERQPIMAWEAGGDTIYWLDAEGVILPQRGDAGQLVQVESDQIP